MYVANVVSVEQCPYRHVKFWQAEEFELCMRPIIQDRVWKSIKHLREVVLFYPQRVAHGFLIHSLSHAMLRPMQITAPIKPSPIVHHLYLSMFNLEVKARKGGEMVNGREI